VAREVGMGWHQERTWTDPGPIDAGTVTRMVKAYRDPGMLVMRASANPIGSYNTPEVLAGSRSGHHRACTGAVLP
jgi:hypothetical protein